MAHYLFSFIWLEVTLSLVVSTLLAIISFGMWLGTNPIIHKFEVFYHVKGDEPENITQRFSNFSKTSNKLGITSILSMLIASWVFLW
jgi:hypothetical protein